MNIDFNRHDILFLLQLENFRLNIKLNLFYVWLGVGQYLFIKLIYTMDNKN